MKYKKFILILLVIIPISVDARSGCCSHHGGVSHCDASIGMYICNDASVSPSCGCEYVAPSTTKRKTTKVTTVRTTTNNVPINTTTLTTTSTISSSTDDTTNSKGVSEKTSSNKNITEEKEKQEEDSTGSVIVGVGILGAVAWFVAKKKNLI